ncbi:Transcription factor [Theobroma cacao]|uniref:Agamous-like MADS-box protein AGL80 n=1 Tax=Theobroma cacao TaxID=3641 RepID=A0AB32WVR3_THECC|nr:PREDICTED: agamous-like MADS-box protein AGL80 [Theobroma cacao]WRX30450.1 Transcription factor [Theobroma cacao]
MARKRVTLELISNESARKVTLKKRKAGLWKKLNELTTLCGVAACAIIFSTYDAQPDIWPSPIEAYNVLEKFKNLPAEIQGKYMMDQNSLLRRSIMQLNVRLAKQRTKNRELEMDLVMAESMAGENNCDLNNLEYLKELVHLLKEKIKFVTQKIESKGFKA